MSEHASATDGEDFFVPTVKVGDQNFVTMVGRDATTATKCLICGASIIDRDLHWDWHAETNENAEVIKKMLRDVIALLSE
jgi:hypothetical protein